LTSAVQNGDGAPLRDVPMSLQKPTRLLKEAPHCLPGSEMSQTPRPKMFGGQQRYCLSLQDYSPIHSKLRFCCLREDKIPAFLPEILEKETHVVRREKVLRSGFSSQK
jgi:hypothetical protein